MNEASVEINEKELREKQADKIIDFLNKIHAFEYTQKLLHDPELKNELSFENFKEFLIRINGIARDIPISGRSTDGNTVYLSGFDEALVPMHEQKEEILEDAFDSLDKIQPGDEAYMLPAVINAVHLFADGNGRTSRIMHTLLQSKNEEEFERNLRLAVGYEGRYNTSDINPGLVRVDIEKIILMRHGIQFEDDKQYSPIFPEGFGHLFASIEEPTSPKAMQFMKIRKIDQPYCFVSSYEYLKKKDLLSRVTMETPSGIALSPLKMEKELPESDWDEIINNYYQLKKEEVEILIDSFIVPHEYKNLDGSMDLRDYFIKEILKRLEENRQ